MNSKQAWEWAKSLWRKLPPKIQCGVVIVGSAAATSLGKILSDPSTSCFAWGCVKHYLGAAVGAGLIAGRAFFMRPGPGPNPPLVTNVTNVTNTTGPLGL